MRSIIILALLLAAVGCGDSDDSGNNGANNGVNNGTNNGTNNGNNGTNNGNNGVEGAALTTINAGLAKGFVPYASDRILPVAEAVGASDADVLCLQEVWDVADVEAVIQTAAVAYPHSYWVETMRDEQNAGCTPEEADPLAECIRTNCSDVPQDELAGCGLGMCGDEFSATTQACQTCIASNLDKDIDGILEACSGGGAAFSYGGRNGLLLLSRTELKNTDHIMLNSTLVQRSVLRADVELEQGNKVSVYCTHLAADLSNSIDYPGEEFDSFEAEQAAQIAELLAWVDDHTNEAGVAVMGDFNTGPVGGEGVVAELPANYEAIVAAGYTSPFVAEHGLCTFCDANTINDAIAGPTGALIDHVFLKGINAAGSIRAFDKTQTIATTEGDKELNLSDHYGVTVYVAP